jgi:hypothetical protein
VADLPRDNNLPAEQHTQDTVAVRSALAALGKKLYLVDTMSGLRIVGHIR